MTMLIPCIHRMSALPLGSSKSDAGIREIPLADER
jgi:hypothetical protein